MKMKTLAKIGLVADAVEIKRLGDVRRELEKSNKLQEAHLAIEIQRREDEKVAASRAAWKEIEERGSARGRQAEFQRFYDETGIRLPGSGHLIDRRGPPPPEPEEETEEDLQRQDESGTRFLVGQFRKAGLPNPLCRKCGRVHDRRYRDGPAPDYNWVVDPTDKGSPEGDCDVSDSDYDDYVADLEKTDEGRKIIADRMEWARLDLLQQEERESQEEAKESEAKRLEVDAKLAEDAAEGRRVEQAAKSEMYKDIAYKVAGGIGLAVLCVVIYFVWGFFDDLFGFIAKVFHIFGCGG